MVDLKAVSDGGEGGGGEWGRGRGGNPYMICLERKCYIDDRVERGSVI